MTWTRLKALAEEELNSLLRSLPRQLHRETASLPVTFERHPSPDLVQDGIDPDTLGLFVGNARADLDVAASPLPAQIILYLENLWEFADGDETVFREELRTTYLHELGHYLGLDELDLEDRGLE